jgi:osmotically-inducible protein OsmY
LTSFDVRVELFVSPSRSDLREDWTQADGPSSDGSRTQNVRAAVRRFDMRARVEREGGTALLALATVLLATPVVASSDSDLQRRVEQRLAKAGFDQRADIRVEVETGVVRLHGITVRYPDLREADRIARKEAKNVVNLLRVVPELPRADEEIRDDATNAVLRWERYGPFDAVGVEVRDGAVKLSGWVETPFKRDEIEERLARVDAVRDVVNNLRVQGFSQSDVDLRLEIHGKIYGDSLFERWRGQPDPPVRVYVNRGRVTLAGTVGSPVEQTTVGHIARGTLAFAVDNQVKVEADERGKEDRKKPSGES